MAWQEKLPSLKKLRRLKLNTAWEPSPQIITISNLETPERHFVITEFHNETIVEHFSAREDAAAYASALYLALSLM